MGSADTVTGWCALWRSMAGPGLRGLTSARTIATAEHVGDRAGNEASSNQSSACGGEDRRGYTAA
jgi:hypothetical protein